MNYVSVRVKHPAEGTQPILAKIVAPGRDRFEQWISPNAAYVGGVYTSFQEKVH